VKLTIIGDGSFGTFLKELLKDTFELTPWKGGKTAESIILAVPISAYAGVAAQCFNEHHLINVCSVQKPSTDILLGFTDRVTSIHPLFGKRTPANKRNSILTHSYTACNDTWLSEDRVESEFLSLFSSISTIHSNDWKGKPFTPDTHDALMSKTHLAAVMAAKQLQIYVERAKDIPDELIPNSFRLMREFVKTLDDMPQGTIESIMANPYF
jgi:prephenate dehydrogenase